MALYVLKKRKLWLRLELLEISEYHRVAYVVKVKLEYLLIVEYLDVNERRLEVLWD